nr:hypothetical protein SHINE37_40146 [Rhizobiaceae bacterium]
MAEPSRPCFPEPVTRGTAASPPDFQTISNRSDFVSVSDNAEKTRIWSISGLPEML